MFSAITNSVRLIRQSWFKAAVLATILAAGGTSAHAQYLIYYDDTSAWSLSMHHQFEYVKATSVFVPGEDYIVAYFDAGATVAAPNYFIYLYLIDWSEAGSLAGIEEAGWGRGSRVRGGFLGQPRPRVFPHHVCRECAGQRQLVVLHPLPRDRRVRVLTRSRHADRSAASRRPMPEVSPEASRPGAIGDRAPRPCDINGGGDAQGEAKTSAGRSGIPTLAFHAAA